ncbi:MAG: GMC family oxidoreductase [Anaerolineae bacterium]|nr:GMC family oxidoreductase [Anaerolineae bacterium]
MREYEYPTLNPEEGRLPVTEAVDVIVVGSGPGGATVAREMARAGRRVAVLERGRDHRHAPYYGTYLGALMYTDRASFRYTREGVNIIRPLMAGGATSMYCGCSAEPPAWFKDYGVELEPYAREASQELKIAPLPNELWGAASTRLADAAAGLGMDWQPTPKFMDLARAGRFNCGAHCMLGCRCGAKWNAAEWVDDAVAHGATFITDIRVESVIIEGGAVAGVRGRYGRSPFELRAPVVVLAAGGVGSPHILQRSGFADAGRGCAIDATLMVYGVADGPTQGHEPPMTLFYEDLEHGYMLSTLVDPWLMYPLITVWKGPQYPLTWLSRWGRTLGVMIKLKDDLAGEVRLGRPWSKPLTAADHRRLAHAETTARAILRRAGADPDSLFSTPIRGTHPSATVRLGDLVDADLQTRVQGLYVCDASVFPQALARPTVLTIIALGKRLAAHLRRGETVTVEPAPIVS